ncbi:MAG: PilZ domain-containing protein [SAR324 cluster bacterium]|nr:PilZ domain-containing protein [SAR324 cluster bacterium]
MKSFQNRLQKFGTGLVILFCFLFLTGQDLFRGREKVKPAELDLEMFKFDQPQSLATQIAEYFYYSWVFGFLLVVIAFIVIYKKFEFGKKIKSARDQEAVFHLNSFLSKQRISRELRQTLEKVAGSTEPKNILSTVESIKNFEKKVKAFKSQNPDSGILSQIFNLRKKLGFEFSNFSIPFASTRMLAPSLKLQCILPGTDKSAIFSVPILAVEEDHILIKPPSYKGKPVDLRKFPYIRCRIKREGLLVYQFKLQIIDQLKSNFNPVVLKHTEKIRKLVIRENPRIPVSIPSTFYMLSEDLFSSHSSKHQYLRLEMVLPQFKGEITDISAGGVKITATELPTDLSEKNLLLFELHGAELRDDLVVRITRIIDDEDGYQLHSQFLNIRDLVRIKIKKFINLVQTGK